MELKECAEVLGLDAQNGMKGCVLQPIVPLDPAWGSIK